MNECIKDTLITFYLMYVLFITKHASVNVFMYVYRIYSKFNVFPILYYILRIIILYISYIYDHPC